MKRLFATCLVLAGCAVAPTGSDPRVVEIIDLTRSALTSAQAAVDAGTMAELKLETDRVFEAVWGVSSGLATSRGAATMHGWKVRWQTTYSNFDPEFAARYGSAPPEITDPDELGIVGRGRALRKTLGSDALNNVIGWQRMDDGVTKAERQPRVDLTYRWDAPKSFWQSTADTGWIFEVQAQALNILKTDYGDDLGSAQAHAAALVDLVRACLEGKDGQPGLNAMVESS